MHRLEAAGFETYAVGGCVRDALLGRTPQDYDLCSRAAPAQMERIFSDRQLVLAGEKHGTVGVVMPDGVVEITTFRAEGDYQDCRHPDWIRFVENVEADLARRDFTVNAMAWSPARGLVDPFGGKADLEAHVLRAVGDPTTRFGEDALRILRGVRFSVRYGLAPEPNTLRAMERCAPLLDRIARERVFDELCKLLPLVRAEDLLRFAPVLTQVLPELAPCVGFAQHSPHHAYDVYTHIAHVTAEVPKDPVLRWAALLHDVAKPAVFSVGADGHGHFYGHAEASAAIAGEVLLRFKAPTALREQVVQLIGAHMLPLTPDPKLLRRRMSRLGEAATWRLLTLQQADFGGKGTGVADAEPPFAQIAEVLRQLERQHTCLHRKDLAIGGNELLALGFTPGPAVGDCLQFLLEQVLEERLPNSAPALQQAAKAWREAREPDQSGRKEP